MWFNHIGEVFSCIIIYNDDNNNNSIRAKRKAVSQIDHNNHYIIIRILWGSEFLNHGNTTCCNLLARERDVTRFSSDIFWYKNRLRISVYSTVTVR